jgi:drug/metabolite transporter (DMT)-like permease
MRRRGGAAGGVAALVVLTLSFALITVLARYLGSGFTIAQQVYLRAAFAFVIGAGVFSRSIRWRVVLRATLREWGIVVLRTVLAYLIGAVLYSKAATLAPVGDVSFIAALPLVSALGLALRRVRATRSRVLCVLGSAVGAGVLSLPGGGSASPASVGRGDLFAVIAMLAIAVGYLGRSWHDGSLNNAEITELTFGVAVAGVVLLSLAHGDGLPRPAGGGVLPWLAVVAAGALNVVNLFLVDYAFEHADPVRAGNLLTLESVWGLAFGLAFFGQVPSLREFAGGTAIVCCAIGLNSVGEQGPPGPDPPVRLE